LKRETQTLLILSGGRGARFGGDKGLSDFEGTPMIRRVFDALEPMADSIVVAVAPGKSSEYRKALGDSALIMEDSEAHRGPLLGLSDALACVSGDLLMLSACDMPFMRGDFYRMLIGRLGKEDAVIPLIGGYYEPIMGVYRLPSLRKAVDIAVARGEMKLSAVLRYLDFISISEKEILEAGFDLEIMTNLNRPKMQK